VTGGKVTVYYDNGTRTEIDLSADMVSGFDNTVVGTQTLTVSYGGFEATYDITVNAKVVQSVKLTAPAKLTYLQGSALDLTGGYLTVVYVSDDNYTEEIPLDSSMISNYNPEKVGVQSVMVTYEGKRNAFAVRVTAKSATHIEVTAPEKLSYLEAKETLDVTGGKVTTYYNNGTSDVVDLTADMVSGFDNTVVGTQTLTVTYGGFTDSFEIEIVAKPDTTISIIDVSGSSAKVSIENNEAGKCYVAVYNTDGQMLSYGLATVTADAGEVTISITPFTTTSQYTVKAFLVDTQGIPVCDCAEH
jgi:hypothetical protein